MIRHFAYMHESVLVHADVDKRAEVDDVAHDAVEHHALAQVGYIHDVVSQNGLRHAVADVAARLLKLADDILERRLAYAELVRNCFDARFRELNAQLADAAGAHVVVGVTEAAQQRLRCAV